MLPEIDKDAGFGKVPPGWLTFHVLGHAPEWIISKWTCF